MRRLFQRLPTHPASIIAGLVALNALLLLPSLALPVQPFTPDSGWREIFTFLWLSADLWLAVGLLWLGWRRGHPRIAIIAAAGLCLLALTHEIYDVFIIATFSRQAVLYNDLLLLPDALNLLLDLAPGWWPLAAVLLVIVGGAAVLLSTTVIAAGLRDTTRPGRFIAVMTAAALIFGAAHLERGLATRDSAAQSSLARLGSNLADSLAMARALADIVEGPTTGPQLEQALGRVRLVDPPSLVLMLIESYGSVLYTDPDLAPAFANSRAALGARLNASGWKVATAFSDSPVSGGTSWLASATLLSGLELDNQHLYQRFISQPPLSMPAFFAAQGFHTVTVQPANRARPGRPLGNPYGFDRVWFRRELAYEGPPYGWGVVPDQYSLNRAVAALPQAGAPTFIYAVTVSSHAPWNELPPLVNDWRILGELDGPRQGVGARLWSKLGARFERGAEPAGPAAYLDAIAYELATIGGLIGDLEPDHPLANAVFLLAGDHQPPYFQTLQDASTPVHIITRDPRLLDELATVGFAPGLDGSPRDAHHLHHAGLFSLLARSFAACYGSEVIPPYQATGGSLSVLFARGDP